MIAVVSHSRLHEGVDDILDLVPSDHGNGAVGHSLGKALFIRQSPRSGINHKENQLADLAAAGKQINHTCRILVDFGHNHGMSQSDNEPVGIDISIGRIFSLWRIFGYRPAVLGYIDCQRYVFFGVNMVETGFEY